MKTKIATQNKAAIYRLVDRKELDYKVEVCKLAIADMAKTYPHLEKINMPIGNIEPEAIRSFCIENGLTLQIETIFTPRYHAEIKFGAHTILLNSRELEVVTTVEYK